MKIDVKIFCRYSDVFKIEGNIFDMVLVRELSVDIKKNKEELFGVFFADRVIDLFLNEIGKFRKRKLLFFW